MKWISVKDRLPDIYSIVMCFCNGGEFYDDTGIFIGYLHDVGAWGVQQGEYCGPPIDVTHWMPLPDPPKDPNG